MVTVSLTPSTSSTLVPQQPTQHNTTLVDIFSSEALRWTVPSCAGTIPKPRYEHTTSALPNEALMVWGGIGGGNDIYMLETSSLTWFQAKVNGTPPPPRFSHSAVVIGAPHQSNPVATAPMRWG